MKRIAFAKLTGAGNDFVVIDNRKRAIRFAPRLARRLCDRRFGIGADGLILVERSVVADYRMMYYNADGSYGGMCGNGGRCVARFAVERGIAAAKHVFEALGYVYRVSVASKRVTLAMKDVRDATFGIRLKEGGGVMTLHSLDTGAPHVVVPVVKGRLNGIAVSDIGRRIRNHRAFQPRGTNVNFVERLGISSIRMRTYERGVEAETLACGTGSVACSMVAAEIWGAKPPIDVETWGGQLLNVNFTKEHNRYVDVQLAGPAVVVFEGTTIV